MLDFTKGYGYIIELEKMSGEKDKKEALVYLKKKMKEINIPITPRSEFEAKYKDYCKNWQRFFK